MANSLLTPDIVARETALQVRNHLQFANSGAVKPMFVDELASGNKVGFTAKYRRPVRYLAQRSKVATAQDASEPFDTIGNFIQTNVTMQFGSAEMTMELDEFSERHLTPAAITVANDIDLECARVAAQNFYASTGTPGTTPNTLLALLNAKKQLAKSGTVLKDVYAIVDEDAEVGLIDGMKGAFDTSVTRESFRDGVIGTRAGFTVAMDQNIHRHTVGPLGGTPLVNGAGQETSDPTALTTSLITDGWTAAAALRLNQGDVITMPGVFMVNPITKQAKQDLQQFVVTADASSDGSGNLTAVISPAIITSGVGQNVSAAPTNNDPITVMGTAATAYPQNIVMTPQALTLVTVPLELLDVPFAARSTMEGISVRVQKSGDILNDDNICRLDVYFAVKATYPEFGVRLWG